MEYFYRVTLQDSRKLLYTWEIVEELRDRSLTQMRQDMFIWACTALNLTPHAIIPIDTILMSNSLDPGMYSCELTLKAGTTQVVEPWSMDVSDGATAQQLFAHMFKGSCDKHRLDPRFTHTLNTFIARE